MRNVHRVPLVCRRLFSSSKPHTRGTKSPKSAFSARFESPHQSTQTSAQPQAAFPDWPGARPQQPTPHVEGHNFRREPPKNLLADLNDEEGGSRKGVLVVEHRLAQGRKKKEVFSDCIGNASGFVNTRSYEAKPAIEQATETQKQLLRAVKNNMHRFNSLPESVGYQSDNNSLGISTDDPLPTSSKPDPAPKATPRTSRFAAVSSSGRRMLSTRSAELSSPHLPPPVRPSLTILDRWAGVRHPSSPTTLIDTSLWRECLAWMLASTSCHHKSSPSPRAFLRRVDASPRHSMYSNHILSFLQPAHGLSSSLFTRGYATRRPSQSSKSSAKITNALSSPKRSHAESKRPRPPTSSPPPPKHRPLLFKRPTSSSEQSSPPPKRLPAWLERHPQSKRLRRSVFTPPPLSPPPPPEPFDMYSPCILIPAPTTPTELCNAMRHLIQSTTPHIPVTRLIATHAQYTTLQSSKSYNIVLAHAIRVAPVPYFAELTTQMRLVGIAWDQKTEALAVRAHIQAGRWEEAIQNAERLWPLGGAPLDVFTELMHFVLTRKATQEEVASNTQRAWKLFPADPNISLAEASPRLAYNVVRLLLKIDQNAQALQLTHRLFDSIDSPTPANTRYCRAILCLILEAPKNPKTKPLPPPPIFHERMALLNSLLKRNPALTLTPDASVVRTLLENLYRSRGRSSTALHVLAEMQSKYGPDVESSAVRRLIARYAIRDRKLDIAWEMYRRELQHRRSLAKEAKNMRRTSWQQAQQREPEVPWAGEDHTPTQSHLEYIRSIGTENVKWSIVERKLRRMDAKERQLAIEPKEAPVVEEPKALQCGEWAPSETPRPVSKSRIERVPIRSRRGKKTKKD